MPEALALHGRLLSLHGGAAGLRDSGLLKSALARGQNLLAYAKTAGILKMAAAYTAGIVVTIPLSTATKELPLSLASSFLNSTATSSEQPRKMLLKLSCNSQRVF